MVLPTGTIQMSDVNVEVGYAFNAPISLNDSRVRITAGIVNGPISMNDLRGKSYFQITGGATYAYGSGTRFGAGTLAVQTDIVSVGTITGGQAPYTYLWEQISGTAASPSGGPNTSFTRSTFVSTGQSVLLSGVYRCKVTDANGLIAYGPMCTVETQHEESS